jgi:SAM-dependent methyltransferase
MTPFNLLLDKLHEGKNPYTGFPTVEWAGTWYGDPGAMREIYAKCIDLTNPGLIIEVGSFVGESAIHMAKLIKAQRRNCAILCVDTWYAGYDHWLGAREKIRMRFGRPDFYEKFIGNVIAHGCEDTIVPFAMDSIGAARVIKWLGLVPSLVYCDASHEEGDVLRDMNAYWELLPSGGGLLCDDWSGHFPGVMRDGARFMEQTGLKPILIEGEKVLFIKP